MTENDMKRRLWAAGLAAIVGLMMFIAASPPASATFTVAPGCTTRSHTYPVSRYQATWVKLGTVTLRVSMCWGQYGYITSTTSTVETTTNTAGKAAGLTIDQFTPYRNDGHSLPAKSVMWKSVGTGQLCLVKYLPICDTGSKWFVQVAFEAPVSRFTNTPTLSFSNPGWMAGCVNTYCDQGALQPLVG